ncbi:MAG: hypothetical protein AAF628_08840 [Planctomycetota bacterium]
MASVAHAAYRENPARTCRCAVAARAASIPLGPRTLLAAAPAPATLVGITAAAYLLRLPLPIPGDAALISGPLATQGVSRTLPVPSRRWR